MGLRFKILLALFLCFGVAGGLGLLGLKTRLDAEFAHLERNDLSKRMRQVAQIVDTSAAMLATLTQDWAKWTAMYEYTSAPQLHASWADQNLDANALEVADLSLVDVLLPQGQVLRSLRSTTSPADEALPLCLRQHLAQRMRTEHAGTACAIAWLREQAALLCAARITRSDNSGAFVGLVLMGRTLDERRLAQWKEQSGIDLQVLGPQALAPPAQWQENAAAAGNIVQGRLAIQTTETAHTVWAPLSSMTGEVSALLEARIPRDFFHTTQLAQKRVLRQAMLAGLVVAVLLGCAVHWLVVRRLRSLQAQMQDISATKAWNRRISMDGADELKTLACDMNQMLELIATQVQELHAQSMTDALTGLPNRRAFDLRLALEWGHARRSAQPLSLLLLDVDFFKRYNDSYGHPAGDGALRSVAAVLCSACGRSIDLAARYGGEEFALLLPSTAQEGAEKMAQHILQLLAEQAIPHATSDCARHLTLSIGLACLHSSDASAQRLLARADQALYAAKAQGRNRLVSSAAPADAAGAQGDAE